MRKILASLLTLTLLLSVQPAKTQLFQKKEESKPGFRFGKNKESENRWNSGRKKNDGIFGDRKKKHKKMLGVGVVIGEPVGIGGRIVFQPTRFGVSMDASVNRIRLDQGSVVTAGVVRVDGQYYMKGFLGNILRLYGFGGFTFTGANFGLNPGAVIQADLGVGGGIRLGKISVTGEAGILVPARGVPEYRPGFGWFTNISVLFWLF